MLRPGTRALALARVAMPGALIALVGISAALRTIRLGEGYWIDEGLSVGIADRPVGDIPGVLRLDGSPPLYYVLLHYWMRLLGDQGEHATHALSLLFATATVPLAWALARSLFGARAGWYAAILYALNPFMTSYAQETRMYTLVVLLSTIATASFVAVFALGRGRGWLAAFAGSMLLLLYTHNWGLFLGAALALAWVVLVVPARGPQRRALVRDGLIAFAAILVLYAPWLPTVVFQARHTGAPWAEPPGFAELRAAAVWLLGSATEYVLLLAAGAGLAALASSRRAPRDWSPEMRAVAVLAIAGFGTPLVAWLVSQAAPAWAIRYLAVALAPLLLLATVGLVRAGAVGMAALALVAALWVGQHGIDNKSNAKQVAADLIPGLRPGDLLISTQPEQIPVLHHYLRDVNGLTWATITGRVRDLGVTDWRDGTARLRAADPRRDLEPLLDRVAPGHRVALVRPEITSLKRWSAPWTSAVRERSTEWEEVVRADPRFRVVSERPPPTGHYRNALHTLVLVRVPMR